MKNQGLRRATNAAICSVALSIVLSACTPAQDAVFIKVEQTVLTDLTNGTALDVLEAAIATMVPQGADIDAILNDAIVYLHDIGALPPNVLPAAQAMQEAIAVKLAAKAAVKKASTYP